MKVLLRDLDIIKQRRPYPNLALMKLSAYHKARGDDVFLNFPLCQPDLIYTSCVFTWNAKKKIGLPPEAIIGGSGIDMKVQLPPEVEHIMPDYSLYPNVNFSLGFTSRGCIRSCPWCIVPEKEGQIERWARIYEFWNKSHRKIVLLDNNLLASPNWQMTMEDLIAEELVVDCNQGLDIRLVNEKNARYLKEVKAKELRFAFDDIAYEKELREGIELLTSIGISSRRLSFYVLVGFTNDDMAVERMKLLHSYNVDVFPMVYKGPDGKEPVRRMLNVPSVFWHGSRPNVNKFLRLAGRLPR